MTREKLSTDAIAELHRIDISRQRARKVAPSDFERFDLILGMDMSNCEELLAIAPAGAEDRVHLFMDYAGIGKIEVPDPYYGEQVMAWVKLKEGETLTAGEVCAFCRGQIMDYKIPTRVKFVTEFPTTVTGKIQKYKMRELSAAELATAPTARSSSQP